MHLSKTAAFAAVIAVVVMSGCSSTPKATTSVPVGTGLSSSTTAAAPTGAGTPSAGSAAETAGPAPGAERAGGEAPSFRFVHPSGWRIDAPGKMIATGGGGSYRGASDFLVVTPLPGSSDPAGVAAAESSTPTGPGFVLVGAPHRISVGGKPATEYEYRADGPPNPVTTKATVLRAVRLYMGIQGGVFRVEYGSTGSASRWDPQGASDIVTTFRTGT